MKLRNLFLIAVLTGTMAVVGCGDDPPSEGNGGTTGTGGTTATGGTTGTGGMTGTGGGSGGDACDQLRAKCEANCVPDSGDLAICIRSANDGEIDKCQTLLADETGCPVEI